MAFCRSCGKQVGEDARFCEACDADQPDAPSESPVTAPGTLVQSPSVASSRRRLIVIGAVIAALVLAVVLAVALTRGSGGDDFVGTWVADNGMTRVLTRIYETENGYAIVHAVDGDSYDGDGQTPMPYSLVGGELVHTWESPTMTVRYRVVDHDTLEEVVTWPGGRESVVRSERVDEGQPIP